MRVSLGRPVCQGRENLDDAKLAGKAISEHYYPCNAKIQPLPTRKRQLIGVYPALFAQFFPPIFACSILKVDSWPEAEVVIDGVKEGTFLHLLIRRRALSDFE